MRALHLSVIDLSVITGRKRRDRAFRLLARSAYSAEKNVLLLLFVPRDGRAIFPDKKGEPVPWDRVQRLDDDRPPMTRACRNNLGSSTNCTSDCPEVHKTHSANLLRCRPTHALGSLKSAPVRQSGWGMMPNSQHDMEVHQEPLSRGFITMHCGDSKELSLADLAQRRR